MITEKMFLHEEIDSFASLIVSCTEKPIGYETQLPNVTCIQITDPWGRSSNKAFESFTELMKYFNDHPNCDLNHKVLNIELKDNQVYRIPTPITEDARESLGEQFLGKERWREWKEEHGVKTHKKGREKE